jgi:chemotaxis protein methyltransferase CheR
MTPAGHATPPPELAFGDYERFRHLLLAYSGLDFTERRHSELALGVRQAFASSTCNSLDEYYLLLQDPTAGRMDLDRLINAVTVNESHFFRDAAQFDALYYQVLPELIQRKRPLRTLRIWSAGCASGEEPFSIAVLLRELMPDIDDWSVTILATDINTEALNRAHAGVYGDWAFREERAKAWRPLYFRATGNRYQLRPELRRMVTFKWLNLAEPVYPSYETNTMLMDLILCRNVTIYFGEVVTQQVVDRFYDALLDGGWLVVGHSEPSLFTYQRFQAHNFPNTVLYQRTGEPMTLPDNWGFVRQTEPAPWSFLPEVLPVEATAPLNPLPDISETPPSPIISADDSPTHDPLERASDLLEYGYSEQARDELLALMESGPVPAQVFGLLGRAYANLGQWSMAEQCCRRATELNNLLLDAYYTLALVMQHQNELPQAIDALKKVVYIDHAHVLGHFGLAGLYHSTGHLSQACKSLNNAHRLLERYRDDQLIPDSGGITAERLREAIARQQELWGAEVKRPVTMSKT